MSPSMDEDLHFPPLMSGERCRGDAFGTAARKAVLGCDAGLVCHDLDRRFEAAIVFAPEVPLARAMAMLPLCGVGFQNALGALGPPEVAVHLEWNGGIRVNGAACGRLRAAASTDTPGTVPDWLVIGIEVPLWPEDDPGRAPERTALYAEGCAEVAAPRLLEAWARHVLNWTTRWESDGSRALHAEWRGLAHGLGEEITQGGRSGIFLGVDENFGMLLREKDMTRLIPLTTLLEMP